MPKARTGRTNKRTTRRLDGRRADWHSEERWQAWRAEDRYWEGLSSSWYLIRYFRRVARTDDVQPWKRHLRRVRRADCFGVEGRIIDSRPGLSSERRRRALKAELRGIIRELE